MVPSFHPASYNIMKIYNYTVQINEVRLLYAVYKVHNACAHVDKADRFAFSKSLRIAPRTLRKVLKLFFL